MEARFDKGVLLITARMREGVGQQRRIRFAGGKQGEGRKIEGEKQAKQAGRSKGAETSRHVCDAPVAAAATNETVLPTGTDGLAVMSVEPRRMRNDVVGDD